MFLAPNLFHANYKMLQLPPNWHGRHGKGEITQRQHVYDECFSILGYTSGIIRVGKNQIGRIQYVSFGAGVVDVSPLYWPIPRTLRRGMILCDVPPYHR